MARYNVPQGIIILVTLYIVIVYLPQQWSATSHKQREDIPTDKAVPKKTRTPFDTKAQSKEEIPVPPKPQKKEAKSEPKPDPVVKDPNSLPYRYTPPPSSDVNITGTDFKVDPKLIKSMGLPPKSFFKLTNETVKDFIFVTAAEKFHYNETRDAIASIQNKFPNYEIHYWDLGLTAKQVATVKSWCNVKYHLLDLKRYPEHIADLNNKAFKFVVIQEALEVHGALLWVDSSFRAQDNVTEWQNVYDMVVKNGGIALLDQVMQGYTNAAWTSPSMYYFLVTDVLKQAKVPQVCTCVTLIYNTELVYRNFLWWMYLCTLDERCFDHGLDHHPERLPFQGFNFSMGGESLLEGRAVLHASRHDQSALNVLLANYYNYDYTQYAPHEVGVSDSHHIMRRWPTDQFESMVC